ncbi:MAG TPA: prepilin peptidase, partial [Actinobacteria bacterium]|nr:prepilin peptidase [Actinomycetota bacterium]
RIPRRYPLVEFANAVLYVLAGLAFGLKPELFPALLFISALVAVFFIDMEHYIIPNVIVLPAAAVGLVTMIAIDPGRWLELILAGIISAAFFFLVAIIKPGGMGMGDVKLAGMMGFYLGKSVLVALFLGFLLGALAGLALVITGRKGRKSRVPFGPFLAVGGIVALFAGQYLLDLYLGLFNQGL